MRDSAIVILFVMALFVFMFKPVNCSHPSEVTGWDDVFDIDCDGYYQSGVCGQHIHAEPYDKNYYHIECSKCGKHYGKNWDFPADKWVYEE